MSLNISRVWKTDHGNEILVDADRLVPYTLAGAALTLLLSRNIMKAVSVLMVDFSCALKLAMPISVLSAIREAGSYGIAVKGGKFLEAVSDADVLVFDKTGTLTKAEPSVKDVVSFNGDDRDELLREAACLEEHFPHSIANAVVKAALEKGLTHEELHTKVEYVVAHGISSSINGSCALIGSRHFIFEDEGVVIPEGKKELFDSLPEDKARFVEEQKKAGSKVIMIGDGINDSPALSAADAGIAVNDGAEIARQIADITISAEGLSAIVILKDLSDGLMKRIRAHYRTIVWFNSGLILFGLLGILPPSVSALLHNTSTILLGLKSTTRLLNQGTGEMMIPGRGNGHGLNNTEG